MAYPIPVPESPRDLLPLEVVNFSSSQDVSCGDCASACCRPGMNIPLSPHEAEALRAAGTVLELYNEADIPKNVRLGWVDRRIHKKAYYKFESDCGNLEFPEEGGPGVCRAFDSEDRPEICAEFKTGSFTCRLARRAAENRGMIRPRIPQQRSASE